jgi:hypothetical protein
VNGTAGQLDLIVVVADIDAECAMKALLGRSGSLAIRGVSFEILRFLKRDSGCFGDVENFLRPFWNQFAHAMVVFDHHGSGQDHKMNRQEMEDDVEDRLARNGWTDRAAAIVLVPELEAWVWSDSPQVAEVLGWHSRHRDLQTWLATNENVDRQSGKPVDPKGAFDRALRKAGTRRSASLFRNLAERVGLLTRCQDPAFAKFRGTLQRWFSPGDIA